MILEVVVANCKVLSRQPIREIWKSHKKAPVKTTDIPAKINTKYQPNKIQKELEFIFSINCSSCKYFDSIYCPLLILLLNTKFSL
jgi:hypothetical protein